MAYVRRPCEAVLLDLLGSGGASWWRESPELYSLSPQRSLTSISTVSSYGLRCKGQQIARTWHICGRGRPAVAPAHGPFNILLAIWQLATQSKTQCSLCICVFLKITDIQDIILHR